MQQPPPSAPLSLKTPAFSHYAVAWSPFHPQLVALASSANYGLVGNGRLHIASVIPQAGQGIPIEKHYDTQDGLYDLAWSEVHENQVVTASGDGSLKLWDLAIRDLPIRAWHEHTREAFSVDWSNIDKNIFSSSSWDGTIKIFTPERPASLMTIGAHQACAYQAMFSPHTPAVIASCSTDGTLRIFDTRQPQPSVMPGQPPPLATPAMTIPGHGNEVLTLDWNKYRPWVIASAGVDRSIKVWDCRMAKSSAGDVMEIGKIGGAICENDLQGHEYAVRKIQWSPHRPDLIASASYDMTCRIWSTSPQLIGRPSLMSIHDLHTEFVVGCAWSLYEEGTIATCSWDHSMHVFRPL